MDRLDLRRPSMAHLRLSAMVTHVQNCIGESHDRAVLFGSSLGGLTACRVAESDARVCALVLFAPAFAIARGWRERLARSRAFAQGKRHVRLVEVLDGHELVASLPRIIAEADAFLAGFLSS